jgi:2-polyprenyl-3-methyl-5-hydroxy-6-metoxy-1,4-benzoquinol methylase
MDPSLYHAFYEIEDRHWWFSGRRRIVDTLLRRFLGAHKNDSAPRETLRILDVGCGTGGMLPVLSRHGRVTGIDQEPLALDYCRRRGITDVHLQESYDAPAAFDVVTLFDVLEHVDDEAGFLKKVGRWLRPGGLLLLTVPAFPMLWSAHDELNQHRRRYTRASLLPVLEAAGFQVEGASYFNMFLFPVAAAVRLLAGKPPSTNSRAGHPSASEEKRALDLLRIGGSNTLLSGLFGSERHLLGRMNLPFGMSLYAAARKRG